MSTPSSDPFAAPESDEDTSPARGWLPGRWTRFFIAIPFIAVGIVLDNGWIALPGILLLPVHRVAIIWRRLPFEAFTGSFWDD